MKFDIENPNPATWFPFHDEGKILLRSLSVDEVQEINRVTSKKQHEYKNGRRYEYETTDEQKQFDMIWDACIIDWEGVTSADDKPVKCTRENKLNLMRKSPSFARFVKNCMDKLEDEENKAREEEVKN